MNPYTYHRCSKYISLVLTVFLCCLSISAAVASEEDTPAQNSQNAQITPETTALIFNDLQEKAYDALHHDFMDDAAGLFCDMQILSPDVPEAVDALWQCALLNQKIAQSSAAPNWKKVKDVYRRFIQFYPEAEQIPEAYLEVGKAYYKIKFYREALSYFRLFLRNFPESSLASEAYRRLGKALIKVGHYREAEKLFQKWIKSADKALKTIGLTGMGDVRFAQGKLGEAKNYYQMVLINHPDYYLRDPSVLGGAGMVNIRIGMIDKGRQQIYHYLSLGGVVDNRVDVLFELAESYYRDGNHLTASSLYNKIVKLADPGSRSMVFSKLRLAQFTDDKKNKLSKWDRGTDLKDPAGDKPYLRILEKFYNDPKAQQARFGLFTRYQARDDLDKSYETGRSYLRNADAELESEVEKNRVGSILLYLVEELLKQKRYQDIYDLYFVEYRHVKDFPDGRLLYMIGQTMESLNLYDQAAVVYYRAMKWPLPASDKIDLYFRRANVYLVKKDLLAADRLLKYLRKIYGKTEYIGEVSVLSAKLAEQTGDLGKALEYYEKALRLPTYPEKRSASADDALRVALELDKNDKALALAQKSVAEKWLEPDKAQGWLLKIGNAFRQSKNIKESIVAYKDGLVIETANETQQQALNLYIGDSYFDLADKELGLQHYTEANKGKDSTWKKLAAERLSQYAIENDLSAMNRAFGR